MIREKPTKSSLSVTSIAKVGLGEDRPWVSQTMMTPIEESERNLPRRVRPFGVKRMVRRYAHLAADPLAVHAGNVGIHGTNTAQSGEYPRVASGEHS